MDIALLYNVTTDCYIPPFHEYKKLTDWYMEPSALVVATFYKYGVSADYYVDTAYLYKKSAEGGVDGSVGKRNLFPATILVKVQGGNRA